MNGLTNAERAEIEALFGYVPEREPLDGMLAAVARIAAAHEAVAWEQGREHGEQNFISCPDDNPYRDD